jgi:hypothetical protein
MIPIVIIFDRRELENQISPFRNPKWTFPTSPFESRIDQPPVGFPLSIKVNGYRQQRKTANAS